MQQDQVNFFTVVLRGIFLFNSFAVKLFIDITDLNNRLSYFNLYFSFIPFIYIFLELLFYQRFLTNIILFLFNIYLCIHFQKNQELKYLNYTNYINISYTL